jgi:hypothetical protein
LFSLKRRDEEDSSAWLLPNGFPSTVMAISEFWKPSRCVEAVALPLGSLLERQRLRREEVAVFATTGERSELDQRQPNAERVGVRCMHSRLDLEN